MAELMEHVQVLTDEIGPRPVSTEEEHQASLYVAQNLQDAGLEVNIDEFATPTGVRWPYALSFALIILGTVLSGLGKFVPGLSTTFFALGLLLVAAALVFYFTERLGRPILSKALCRGVSQNVVARYVPSSVARERRRRKVVVVAHLDTVRAQPEAMPAVVNALPVLKKVLYFCMIGVGVAFLVRMLPIPWPETVDFVLWIVSLVACAFLLVCAGCIVANRFMPYVTGANDNASAIAVMLGLAQRLLDPAERERYAKEAAAKKEALDAEGALPVETFQPEQGSGTFDPQVESFNPELLAEPVIHGEEAAVAAGLVPEGAQIEYAPELIAAMPAVEDAAEEPAAVEPEDEPAPPAAVSVEAAGAAVAASAEAAAATVAAAAVLAGAAEATAAPAGEEADPSLPSWYTAAKRKAAAAEAAEEPAEPDQRSRYASMPTTREEARALQAQRREAEEQQQAERAANADAEGKAMLEHIQSRSVNDILVDLGVDPAEIPTEHSFEAPAFEEVPVPSFDFATLADEEPAVEPEPAAAEPDPEPAAPAPDNVISLAAFKGQLAEADVEDLEPTIEGGYEADDVIDDLAAAANRAGLTGRIPVIGAESNGFATYAAVDAGDAFPAPEDEPAAEAEAEEPEPAAESAAPSLTGSFRALQARRAAAKEAKAAQPKRNAKPTARRAGSDFVPTKAVDLHADATQMLSASYQAAAVDSEFHDTIQAAPQQPAFDPFAPKGDPAANASLINPSVSTAFPAVSPALSAEFPTVGDYAANPGSTSSFPSLTGTFPTIGGATGAFGTASASDFDDAAVDAFNGFAPNMEAQIDAPASRMHGFMDKVGGVFGKLGRKKRDQDQNLSDGWTEDESGWKGGGYFDQELADSHAAVRARAAQIKEAVVSMTENDLLDKEVWFVALGASSAGNKGMKNFLELHKSELRGALIINLEGVGAGDICFVDYEGASKARRSDRRLQSLVRKASKELDGNEMSAERLNWRDTDATPALEAGMRGMTIMGFDGVAPTGWHWTTDYADIIEPEKMEYVTSILLKMIENS
ncbi:MAG: M28 family peptidase [Coriobacteriales bacterium]